MPVTISGMRSSSAIYVQQGGTGRATLQSGSLLVGNGADNVGLLAPGTEGQILTVVSGVWTPADNAGGNGGGGGGGGGSSVDYSLMSFTGSNFAVGDIVAMSGSLIKADYSGDMSSNVIGAVTEVSGNITTVKLYGEATALSASAIAGMGTPVYIGPSGSVIEYSSIPSGNYITQVGFISPNSGKVVLQPRVFGIKA